MRSSNTIFPMGIDTRMYWSDLKIDNMQVMSNYQDKLSKGQYSSAYSELLSNNVDYYGGWLINKFRNRLLAMEDYLPYVIKPNGGEYGDDEPTSESENILINTGEGYVNSMIWIG